jgi:hypothetical protein
VLTQGSGGNVTVPAGRSAAVYADGGGATAVVVDISAGLVPVLTNAGVTSTASELNILDGVTSSTAELNILDGVTATTAELNILDGVTSTTAELNYVDGVTSNVQTQLNNRAVFATYGGTANAITLTATGAALTTGLRVSFIPTAANTAATTINLNGGGAVTVQPLARSGVALPSGYIRADVPVTAIYNGTVWLIERQVEYGTGAKGDFTRVADGTLICRRRAISIGSAGTVLTFPAAFSADPAFVGIANVAAQTNGESVPRVVGVTAISTTTATCYTFQAAYDDAIANARVAGTIQYTATGVWF